MRKVVQATFAVAMLGALVGLGLLINALTNAQEGGDQVAPADSPLLTDNRTVLALCIDAAGGGSTGSAASTKVYEAMNSLRDELAQDGYVGEVLSLVAGAEVTAGCPKPAALDESNRYEDPKTGLPTVIGKRTEAPSPYRLHIYVVSRETLEAWFGNQPYGRSAEQLFCDGFTCGAATSGLYVADLSDVGVLAVQLRHALGLVSGFDEFGLPTPSSPTAMPGPSAVPAGASGVGG